MKNTFKNLGKTGVLLGCTVLQLIAVILRGISLIFEAIGLAFRRSSDFLMNVSTHLLNKIGIIKAESKEAA